MANTYTSMVRHSYRHLGRNGRLGNQLFQIAGTIGRAHRTGDIRNAVFPTWSYAPYFSVPESYFEVPTADERTIDGGRAYLQNLAELADCADVIRRFFAPSPRALDELSRIHPDRGDHHHVTAVHVRRGDYLNIPSVVTTCPVHYFATAMDDMRQRHPGTHFVVYSDDPQWCIDHLAGNADTTIVVPDPSFVPLQQEMADFNAMRASDAHIISNSTFSWWPAWLAESTDVICPDRWMNEGAQVQADDIIPSSWHRRSIDPIGPMRTPLLLVSEGETGYIVTDNRSQRVHHLNPLSTLLFELCTGSNTMHDIAVVMNELVPIDSWRTGLDELVTLGLVSAAP
jgi:hypothetical protein